jgi:hypothetical protein
MWLRIGSIGGLLGMGKLKGRVPLNMREIPLQAKEILTSKKRNFLYGIS